MKREILGALIAAACTAGGSAMADGYDDTGAVYISPMADYTFLDKNRLSNNGTGYQLGLGYNFAPNVAAELDFSPNSFKIPHTGASEKLNALSIDVLYKFLPVTSLVRPYALLGGGRMTDEVGGHGPQNTSVVGGSRRRRAHRAWAIKPARRVCSFAPKRNIGRSSYRTRYTFRTIRAM